VKNISALLGLLLVAAAAAQTVGQEASSGLMAPGDLPPALSADATESLPMAGDDAALEPIAESIAAGDPDSPLDGSILGEPMKLLQGCSPYFESSGTWLERGFWYAEMDYLFLNRGWDRKGLRLAFEATQGTVPDGQFINAPVVGVNELRIRGERPGAEGVGRLTLGRFMFRDSNNRDHSVEASWTGGGEWSQSGNITAATTAGLDVSDFIDRVNRSFDGARSMDFSYDTEMNTVEANYVVKQRMKRDQMVMQPSGAWVRKATPTRTFSYLAGLRYVNHREFLDWNAQDITVRTTPAPALLEDGTYDIHTESNMFGTQFGGSIARETARWSLALTAKGGPMWNRIDVNSRFQVGESVIVNSGQTNSTEDDLAFYGEAQLLGKWHLRPNVSLRAGLELLFIDSIALAPHQVNFIPGGYEQIATSGDNVYMGTSFGIESYW
jgi:Putative beta barrel porin-7 (BBP7)